MFIIKEPKWKDRTVGLSEHQMIDDVLEIEIVYRNTQGNRMWPKPLYIRKEDALKYPEFYTKRGKVKLRMIPIRDLREFI